VDSFVSEIYPQMAHSDPGHWRTPKNARKLLNKKKFVARFEKSTAPTATNAPQ
jgi:hypothetical protein